MQGYVKKIEERTVEQLLFSYFKICKAGSGQADKVKVAKTGINRLKNIIVLIFLRRV